ncbi:predicted GPI-anchored protein 58 [Mastomys coucha]|uniref:predicted GPI-anchored protein 58 n=1 Tax=Mastomys coucha TaxID=35658 RepID=UPI0012617816|nr:predicted GPI-anchored protein 58 [Mastomys coucha]
MKRIHQFEGFLDLSLPMYGNGLAGPREQEPGPPSWSSPLPRARSSRGGGRSGQLFTKALPPTARDAAPQTLLPAAAAAAAAAASPRTDGRARKAAAPPPAQVRRKFRAAGPRAPVPRPRRTHRTTAGGRNASSARRTDTRGAGVARAPVERRHRRNPLPSRQPPKPARPSGTPSRVRRSADEREVRARLVVKERSEGAGNERTQRLMGTFAGGGRSALGREARGNLKKMKETAKLMNGLD